MVNFYILVFTHTHAHFTLHTYIHTHIYHGETPHGSLGEGGAVALVLLTSA